jgi:hypothetical protein
MGQDFVNNLQTWVRTACLIVWNRAVKSNWNLSVWLCHRIEFICSNYIARTVILIKCLFDFRYDLIQTELRRERPWTVMVPTITYY